MSIEDTSFCNKLNRLVNNPEFSDITFLIKGEKIYASRLHLASQCEVFKKMLYGKLREASQHEIVINDPNVLPDAFLSLIKFLCTGSVEIGPNNILHVLYLAKLYAIDFLMKKCVELVKEMISDEDVLIVWDSALNLGEEEIAKICEGHVTKNTENILKIAGENVSKEVLLKIVTATNLNIEEIDLFNFVHKWIEVHEQQPKEVISEIISHIRFPLISTKNLVNVVKPTKLAPMEVYVEALEYQGHPDSFDKSKIQFQLRTKDYLDKSKIQKFVYKFDWDTNGLFYFLNTNHQLHLVQVVSSKRGNVSCDVIINRLDQVWQTTHGIGSYIIIDLSIIGYLKLDCYTIRHRSDYDTTSLRNWKLEASNNKINWDLIMVHVNDTKLANRILSTASWPVYCDKSYNTFKITMTGHCSDNVEHFNLSNIEFYGELIKCS